MFGLFLPWQSALQQTTKISWGLPDFSFVSYPGFCCFHEAACLSCFQIFHSIVLHGGCSVCSEHTYVKLRRSCSAQSCNPLGWTIWLIQYRSLHSLSPYSPSDTFAMCMTVVLGDENPVVGALTSSWSSHAVKSPSKCLSRYKSGSIEQHCCAGGEGEVGRIATPNTTFPAGLSGKTSLAVCVNQFSPQQQKLHQQELQPGVLVGFLLFGMDGVIWICPMVFLFFLQSSHYTTNILFFPVSKKRLTAKWIIQLSRE